MSTPSQDLLTQASRTASSLRFWWIFYWTLYNYFGLLSWVVVIAVPFGLAILLYVPPEESRIWNVALLSVSAFGLVLQVLASVMRFRERAILGRRSAARLEVAILKFREGKLDTDAMLREIQAVLEAGCEEPGP
jgi:hypothetical protein